MAETTSYAGTLAVASIGGNSMLEFIESANYRFTEAQQQGAPASRFGGNMQGLKMNGEISFSLFSDQTTDIRVSHLDLTAADIGSVDLLDPNILFGFDYNWDVSQKMNPGTGQLWSFPVVTDGLFTGSLRLAMMTNAAAAFVADFMGGTYANKNGTFTFTLNGVSFSIPIRMSDLSLPVSKDGLLEYSVALGDRSARSGVTVLPSGTSGLLAQALNAPRTALAFVFRPKAHPNNEFSGNMILKSMRFSVNDGALVPFKYTYATQGTIAGAATAS
jgi:hypothetical protein